MSGDASGKPTPSYKEILRSKDKAVSEANTFRGHHPRYTSSNAVWLKVLGCAPKFYVLRATLEVPSEALLHPQELKIIGGPIVVRLDALLI